MVIGLFSAYLEKKIKQLHNKPVCGIVDRSNLPGVMARLNVAISFFDYIGNPLRVAVELLICMLAKTSTQYGL